MVYCMPEAMRYFSAFLFHKRMFPLSSFSGTRPIVFKKFSGCVPPIEERNTKCFIPALLAASIWFFEPSQSTLYGSKFFWK